MSRIRGLTALTGALVVAFALVTFAGPAGADDDEARAVLRNASGAKVATVTAEQDDDGVWFKVTWKGQTTPGFHGFHVHANDNDATDTGFGSGCDPSNGFRSADGHLNLTGATHGSHAGDLPVLLVNEEDGSFRGRARFLTNAFTVDDLLEGPNDKPRALIVHALADNYANIPLDGTNGYTANGTAQTTTKATGDAGVRIACGLFEEDD